MPKKKKIGRLFTSTKGNLFIVAGLVAITAALAGGVRFFKAEPVLFFTIEDFQQRQAMRDAPENAYFTLADAAGMLPQPPSGIYRIKLKDRPGVEVPYESGPGSLAARLSIQRPDDHPDFTGYMAACAPAVEKTLSASEQSYFLFPQPPSVLPRKWNPFTELQNIVTTAILYGYKSSGDVETFARDSGRFLKVTRMCSPEMELWFRQQLRLPETGYYDALRMAVRKGIAPGHAARIREMLAELGPPCPDRRALADEVFWRFDNTQLGPLPDEYRTFPASLGARIFLVQVRKAALAATEERDTCYELAETPPAKVSEFPPDGGDRPRPPGPPRGPRGDFMQPRLRILRAARDAANMQAEYWTSVFALAIEEYRAEKNTYPAKLEELTPAPLSALPEDPITGGQFFYRLDDAYYMLYSAGEDGKDDGGSRRSDNILISKDKP